MDLDVATKAVSVFLRCQDPNNGSPYQSQGIGHRRIHKIGSTLERFKMSAPDYSPIYDPEIYDKCLQVIALQFLGFTPMEVDQRLGWGKGTTALLHNEHPKLMQRAEQAHLERSYLRFHQAKVRELDLLSQAVEAQVVFLAQVVQGGGTAISDQFRNRTIREVTEDEATVAQRMKAAEILLKFTQERFKVIAMDPDNPKPGLPDIPEEFKARVQKAQDAASNVVKIERGA